MYLSPVNSHTPSNPQRPRGGIRGRSGSLTVTEQQTFKFRNNYRSCDNLYLSYLLCDELTDEEISVINNISVFIY